MLECLLIPNPVSVENEDLPRGSVSEDHGGVEHVGHPEYLRENLVGTDFFEVADVHDISFLSAEQKHFVENDLLRMGQELSMIGEVVHVRPLSGDLAAEQEDWQKEEIAHSSDQTTQAAEEEVVSQSTHEGSVGLSGFVKE